MAQGPELVAACALRMFMDDGTVELWGLLKAVPFIAGVLFVFDSCVILQAAWTQAFPSSCKGLTSLVPAVPCCPGGMRNVWKVRSICCIT